MDTEAKFQELTATMEKLLEKDPPDYDKVKMTAGAILALRKSFPAHLRFRIWEVLLDVSERVWF